MKTATARVTPQTEIISKTQTAIPEGIARTVAQSWMVTQSVDSALAQAGVGISAYRPAPAVQNAAASIVADILGNDARIITSGFQPYAWMVANGQSVADIACIHLGKKLPANVSSMTVEDIIGAFTANQTTIVALHIESSNGWNDVRTISAAAVKAETPMLMVVSTAVPAPEGVTINVANDWTAMANSLRDAVASVQKMGTIRVVAVSDNMSAAGIEVSMMEASAMSPEAWAALVAKNNDGADLAMNIAYQAPVESF